MHPALKRVIEKDAGIGSALKGVGKFFKDTPAFKHVPTIVKHAPGAAALGWLGESTLRTGANLANGKFEVSGAPTTASVLGSGLNYLGNVTGVNPLIQSVGNNLATGFMSNPAIQDGIAKGNEVVKNVHDTVVDPSVTKGISAFNQFVDAVKGNTIAQGDLNNTVNEITSGATQGMAKGLFKSMGESLTDPKFMATALISGTAPLVIWDLLNRKKREERAVLDKKILQALQKQSMEKTARFNWARFLNHKPTVPADVLGGLAAKGSVSPSEVIKAVKPYEGGWSLLNNPITRNPGKSLAAGSVGLGTITGAADVLNSPLSENTVPNNAWKIFKGMASGPMQVIHDLEAKVLGKGLENDGYNKLLEHPAVANAKTLVDNIQNAESNIKNTLNAAVSNKESLSTPNVASTWDIFKKDLPWYAAGTAAIAAPFALHYGYDRMMNRKINKKMDQVAALKEDVMGN